MTAIPTYRGPLSPSELGPTLIHEHIFVRNPELEVNLPDEEWDERTALETAVAGLEELRALGVASVVDLTVPGLGRDVNLVARVARRAPINIIAATGWYTANVLPLYFAFHGPTRLIDEPDPLIGLFVRDLTDGIAGTAVRAAVIKVVTDADGITPDVARVMEAAAAAHRETGATIMTHARPASGTGHAQLAFLGERGVDLERVVVGHCGDTDDIDDLRALMETGATIGMDRFGMEHVLPDDRRIDTVRRLLELGYADRMVLSHDAAFYSHVTPPSWRARNAPRWRMDTIPRHILPALRAAGVPEARITTMLVENPARLLAGRAV